MSQRILQAHCQSPTSQPARQSFVKELAKPTQRKIELKKISHPAENKKYATAQPNTTQKMTAKLNNDNGLQGQTKEHQLPTAVLRNGGFSASSDSFVVGSSAVLRLNFCAKNPPLRKAAKR
jgi:hypothetical protein